MVVLSPRGRARAARPETHREVNQTMTLFELGILLTTAGISGVGCAALCGAVLDRIGRAPIPNALPAPQSVRTRH